MSPSPIAPPPTEAAAAQRTPARARAIETLVLVASVVGVRLVGVLLLSASSWSVDATRGPFGELGAVFDVTLLLWVGLVAAVQFGMRRARRSWRWTLVVLAAPAAVLVSSIIASIPAMLSGLGPRFASLLTVIEGIIFLIVVGLGLVIAAACLAGKRRAISGSAAVLLAVGSLLALVLLWQFFELYFVLWWTPPAVTEEHGIRYLVTAGAAAAALLGALALAIAARRRGLIITAGALAAAGLIVAFALQVPQGRFIPDPPPPPAERSYTPCFGEGDPGCVGG